MWTGIFAGGCWGVAEESQPPASHLQTLRAEGRCSTFSLSSIFLPECGQSYPSFYHVISTSAPDFEIFLSFKREGLVVLFFSGHGGWAKVEDDGVFLVSGGWYMNGS